MTRRSLPALGVAWLALSLAAPAARAQPSPSPPAPTGSAPAPPPTAPPAAPIPPAGPPGQPPGGTSVAPAGSTAPGSTQPSTGAPIAPVTASSPGQPISPISPISPAGGDAVQPINPADTEHETRWLLPVQVTGGSDGAASARVGFGFLRGTGKVTDPTAWDIGAVLEAEVSTSRGLSTLLGLDGDGELTQAPIGSLRLSASFAHLDFTGEGGSAYPPLVLYVGGAIGRASFTYLGPGPERRDMTLPPTYQQLDQVEVPWSAGASVVYVPSGRRSLVPTVEGEVAIASSWTPSTDVISWCEPVGDVLREGTVATPEFDAATRCKKSPLGAPTNAQEISLAAQGGFIDAAANATWRAALGLKVTVALNEDATDTFRLSLRAPFYVTLARAPQGTEYRGLIRLMPSLNIARREEGSTDIAGLLELSFLGQRSLFADNYNEL